MTVELRSDLLRQHKQLHLQLAHAAIGTYPCHTEKTFLPVNRLLFVFADSGCDDSYIRDLATGQLLPMRRDHGYFIPCRHEIDQHQSEALHFVSFQFNLDLFYGFDIMSRFPECRVISSHELIIEAQRLINDQNTAAALCGINTLIYDLCYGWLEEKNEILQQEMKHFSEYETLLDFIEKQGDARITVGQLADMRNMRQDVFSRKFVRDLGISPKDFISRTLVRKASMLLSGSSNTVKEVAYQLNFNSEYYFSRFFKQHTGMSPTQFRRQVGNK